jgi:hypothetical protein
MGKLFQQLLQQAGRRAQAQVAPAARGFANTVVAPIVRSAGVVDDAVVRPASAFGQRILNQRGRGNIVPNFSGSQLVQQAVGSFTPRVPFGNTPFRGDAVQRFMQEFGGVVTPGVTRTAASLRPGPTAAAFPLDDALTRLGGQARYLQRQAQTGLETSIGQVGGIYKNLQGIGPTALNPLATRTPTTLLGRAGKFINPLNPTNAVGYLTGGLISTFLPENDPNRGNAEIFAYTPGGLIPKIAATTIFGATPAGVSDEKEAELIRQSNALRQIGQNYKVNGIEYDVKTGRAINPPVNTLVPARSFGGGNSPPPPPALPASPGSRQQAGQQTPVISDVPVGGAFAGGPTYQGAGVSNGAGVPALRQNVQNRALSQEVLNAAQQYSAPTGIPLSSFYEGQQQLGRRMQQTGELQRQLTELGGATGMTPEALMQWAQANPGLAYRELQRLQRRRGGQ